MLTSITQKLGKAVIDTCVLINHGLLTSSPHMVSLGKYEKEFLMSLFENVKIFITPHVLAEFSNHLKRENISQVPFFKEKYNIYIQKINEEYIKKDEIWASAALKFGITDASITILADNLNIPLLSYDQALIGWCRKQKPFISSFHIHEIIYNP